MPQQQSGRRVPRVGVCPLEAMDETVQHDLTALSEAKVVNGQAASALYKICMAKTRCIFSRP